MRRLFLEYQLLPHSSVFYTALADLDRFQMRFKVMAINSCIVILFIVFCFSSDHFTAASQIHPAIQVTSLTGSNYNATLTLISELTEGGAAKDIEVVGDLAYVLSNSGLNIYNVSDSLNAFELGHYYSDGYLGHSIGVCNDYVFAAADDRGLKIINVTDPSNPELANTYSSTRPAAVFIQGNLLFVANWDNDFEIYNVLGAPTITEVIRFAGDGFHYAYAANDLAFGFANNGSLLIANTTNPEQIEKIGWIDDEEISTMAIDGNYWYTGGSSGIKVFYATNPSEPALVSHYPETESTAITNMAVIDGFLYASDYYQGFRIFEISDASSLSEIGLHEVGGSPLGFLVVGDLAYVASQIRGIQIMHVQIIEVEPESSTETDSITTDESSSHYTFSTSERSVEIKVDLAILCAIMLILRSERRRY